MERIVKTLKDLYQKNCKTCKHKCDFFHPCKGCVMEHEDEMAEGKVCRCFDIIPIEYKNYQLECPYYVK